MGTFYKALEQAERERALKEQAGRRSASEIGTPIAPDAEEPKAQPTVEVRAPASVFQRTVEREALPRSRPAPETTEQPFGRVEEHLVSLLSPTSFGAEQYRALRLRVEQLHKTTNLS